MKIKEANQMNHIVSVVTNQIHEMKAVQINQIEEMSDSYESKVDKNSVLKNRLLQLVAVMQQGGQFKGFNRKIQIRTLKWNIHNGDEVQVDCKPEVYAPSTPSPVLQPVTREFVPCISRKSSPLPPINLGGSSLDCLSHFELRQGVERVVCLSGY